MHFGYPYVKIQNSSGDQGDERLDFFLILQGISNVYVPYLKIVKISRDFY